MKRIRYETYSGIYWGDLEGGNVHRLASIMGRRTGEVQPLSDVRLLAPCEPRTIVCVGKNYADHVVEMGGDASNLPTEPGLFLKAPNTVSNPGEGVPYPAWSENLQFEGEMAVVIAKTMRRVTPEDALGHVLGYTCAIDITARDKQRQDLQWTRGKSADRFMPIGPWIETDLEPCETRVTTAINGDTRQDAPTSQMIFDVPHVLSYISQFMTLEPGDVVLTGTPEGVGPLAVGDEIRVEVDGIGTLTAFVEDAPA